MKRTVLGRTGMEVNRLGFGGIPIQRVDEAQAVKTVLHAVEAGVDFIDTSRAYTTSERRIGMALAQTDRRVVIASKSQQKTADGICADLETSLRELQQDRIDLYQAHFVRDADDYRRVTGPGGALEGLKKLKDQGLVGHIGLTSHSLDLLDLVVDEGLFDTIMVCFGFLEPTAGERIIPKALNSDIGVIAMKSFSGGMIDDARLAVKYGLSQPGIVIIPGVENEALFDENWAVFESEYWHLSPREEKEIDQIRNNMDRIFCRRCDYCQPCSENIPIQHILGIKSMLKRMGNGILQREWVQAGIERAKNCSECGDCMTRCPYDLPIPDLIRENIAWLENQAGR